MIHGTDTEQEHGKDAEQFCFSSLPAAGRSVDGVPRQFSAYMEIKKEIKKKAYAIRFSLVDAKKEIGRAYLYVLKNDLHDEPFGFIEDVFVEKAHRGKNLGARLIKAALAEAKKRSCYKVITTSRHGREKLHRYYESIGLKKYGLEFRIDFSTLPKSYKLHGRRRYAIKGA